MRSSFFLKPLLSAICLLSCGVVFAKITVTDLKPLFGENFDAKVKVVQVLSKEDSPEAIEILQALSAEVLFLSPQGAVVQKGDHYVDVLTGQTVSVKSDELQDVILNNQLRG